MDGEQRREFAYHRQRRKVALGIVFAHPAGRDRELAGAKLRRVNQLVVAVLTWAGLPLWPVSDYSVTLAVYVGLSSLVAMGLVLLTGVGGLTSFGQAAFVGVGAYAVKRSDLISGNPAAQVISFLVPPGAAAYNIGDGLLPALRIHPVPGLCWRRGHAASDAM